MKLPCSFLLAAILLLDQVASVSSFTSTQRPCSTTTQLQASQQQQQLKDSNKIEKFTVSSSRGSKAVKSSKMSNSQPSGWDNLKSVVYGSADIVGSLTEKIKGGSQESDVQGGYSSV